MNIRKYIPILSWLPNYQKSQLKGDIIAGITVAIILIPQGIAYALITGIPPIYGLYTALIPQIIYAIFGTSRQVAVGPVAMDSLIVATGVSSIAIIGQENYLQSVILLALMVGLIQLLMGVLRLGFIANFLSRPVILGFSSAVSLIIGLNQFRNLFGVNFVQSDQIHVLVRDILDKITQYDFYTTFVGILACLVILGLKKIKSKLPSALVVVVLGTLVMYWLHQELSSIAIIKFIPSGLPKFDFPVFEVPLIQKLFPIALTLVMIGYLEIISIGKTLELKQDKYIVNPNQELVALGLSNIMGGLFKGFPATASFSRSAINADSGAKTGVAAFVSALIVMLTLLFFTPLFYYLPKTVLAAIIIVAVFNLIKIKEAKELYVINKVDFWLLIITFMATLFLGIKYGISIGVALSLIVLIFRTSKPYVTELGKVPDADFYRNKNRFCDVILKRDILVFRFDAQLFFANASYFRDCLDKMVKQKGKELQLIVLDAESINYIDSTGIAILKERILFYKKKNIQFYFAGVKGPVRDILFQGKLLDIITIEHFFRRANDAVLFYRTGDNISQKKYAKYIHS